MVTDVSATLVESTTLRRAAGSTARACSAIGRSPCSGSTRKSRSAASGSSAVSARRMSPEPRQENQYVARVVCGCGADGADDLLLERAIVDCRKVLDSQRKRAAFAAHRARAPEQARDRLGVERCAHYREAERGTALAQSLQEHQEQVREQAALVKFVEHDLSDAGQLGLSEQSAARARLR